MKTNLIRKFTAVAALLTISSIPSLTYAQGSEVSNDTRLEIEKLNKTIEMSIAKKSFGNVAAMYNEDATMITAAGKKLHGSKEIGSYWYEMSNCREFKSEITELGGNGKIIYQIGKWTMTVEKDGKLVTTSSDVVMVWKRESNFEYKIQLQSLNNSITVNEQNVPINSAQAK